MNSENHLKLLDEYLAAAGETATLDYKSSFDPNSNHDWCELIKDFVAMANSGGGVVIIGVNDDGSPNGQGIQNVCDLDPADVCNKIEKYTACRYSDFRIILKELHGKRVGCFVLGEAPIPIVFTKPGTYAISGPNQQKTAFGQGTIYFRHGPKSEPGTSEDLRLFVEREVGKVRNLWLENVRKVVEAPAGSQIVVVSAEAENTPKTARNVRLTSSPDALLVRGLNPNKSHPHRQKEAAQIITERLGAKHVITSSDVYLVRKAHGIEERPDFLYWPKHSSALFSNEFIDWFVDEYKRNPKFIEETKLRLKKLGGINATLVPNDEHLPWLREFMQKHGLSNAAIARKIGMSDTTISQIRHGKYPGDVAGVLKRLEKIRQPPVIQPEQ